MRQRHIFYQYDTVTNFNVLNYQEHRDLHIQALQHSRYFLANKAKFDEPDVIRDQEILAPRFFEGAASGTVMLGAAPQTQMFRDHFDWPDAVIHLPVDITGIAEILADLDNQPDRLARIRQANVAQALLRHDWVYRWEQILQIANLPPTPAMERRKTQLQDMANQVMATDYFEQLLKQEMQGQLQPF